MKSGIKLTRSSESIYICQTRRNLQSKIKEYATLENSEVCKYLYKTASYQSH